MTKSVIVSKKPRKQHLPEFRSEALRRVIAGGYTVEYGPVNEPWGVRRFYVRDPAGRLINILAHL